MMIILEKINNGHISQARSDDGMVTALITPTTTLHGNFRLVDSEGRDMDRGVYKDEDGFFRANKVSADIWQSAIGLMADWNAYQSAREDADRQRAMDRDVARHQSIGERIAQDMDRVNSDL